MNKEYHFYDTSALLERSEDLFENKENIIISSITLEELDNLKIKNLKARKIIRLLYDHDGQYKVVFYSTEMMSKVREHGLESDSPDMKILACAINYDCYQHPDETIFYTNDIHQKITANLFFGEDSIRSIEPKAEPNYSGYRICQISEEDHAHLYEWPEYNLLDLLTNEYAIITDNNSNVIDKLRWDGNRYQPLKFNSFTSSYLGDIRPITEDVYQQLAFDSLTHNKITLLKGKAGSGKSLISLGYLFYLLEKHKIDKIIVFCNTVATKNSAKLGFYSGSRTEKLLDSQIGNFLISKLGSQIIVEELIKQEKIMLLPMSDVRGFDTSGMRAGIYITEAQNMDVSLMKLALQRVGEDSIIIIDGDDKAQVDDPAFEGSRNGMTRLSQVFRGFDLYGEVELQEIHRSRIAERAELM